MNGIVILILQILVLLITLYLAFFKSYFSEKGKNLATTQDIEIITKKVEKIKYELQVITQTSISLKLEEKNALINHYENTTNWINALMDVYYTGYDTNNIQKFEELDITLSSYKFKYNTAFAKKELFVEDLQITGIDIQLGKRILELHNLTSVNAAQVKHIYEKLKMLETSSENSSDLNNNLFEERNSILKQFFNERLSKYNDIVPLERELRKAIYRKVKQIASE